MLRAKGLISYYTLLMKKTTIILMLLLFAFSCSSKKSSHISSKKSSLLIQCIISPMADENFVGREDNGEWYIFKVLDDKTYQISCNRDFPMTPGVNELLNKTIRLKDEQWDKIYRMYDELKEEKSYVSERNAKDVWRIHIKVKDKTFEFYQHENVKTLQYQLFEYLMELSPIVIYLHGFA